MISDNFAYFLIKTYAEAILMSTHNIGFYEDLTKIIFEYHQISSNMDLISSSLPTTFFMKN